MLLNNKRMEKWQKYLQILGLTDAESKVYLYSLKAGPQSVLEIARSVKLSRVTIYNVIGSLTKLGLMTSIEKGKKQVYAAEPPERVVALANNRINSMQATVKEINHHINELKLMESGDKPVVKMYEGMEAFRALQEDVLNTKTEEVFEYGNLDDIDILYPNRYDQPYFKKLIKKKINRKIIFLSKKQEPGVVKKDNNHIIYTNKGDFHGDIVVYDDIVWMSSFKGKQIAVMIKDKDITSTVKYAFDNLWDKVKKDTIK